ncbi:hypothetical protein PG994_004386 [Apiospora phragmitis]|uniref:Uncharacterized protein n=1 Tax=Apiospora phragmitis TaxID=2905665 RepID=A0ABR1VQK1_9PEZI
MGAAIDTGSDLGARAALIAVDKYSACRCPNNCQHKAGTSCKYYVDGTNGSPTFSGPLLSTIYVINRAIVLASQLLQADEASSQSAQEGDVVQRPHGREHTVGGGVAAAVGRHGEVPAQGLAELLLDGGNEAARSGAHAVSLGQGQRGGLAYGLGRAEVPLVGRQREGEGGGPRGVAVHDHFAHLDPGGAVGRGGADGDATGPVLLGREDLRQR